MGTYSSLCFYPMLRLLIQINEDRDAHIMARLLATGMENDKMKEIQDILKVLDQGVRLLKEDECIFENEEFKDFISQIEKKTQSNLNSPLFQELEELLDTSSKSHNSTETKLHDKLYSLNEIMTDKRLHKSVFRSNFESEDKENKDGQKYEYV